MNSDGLRDREYPHARRPGVPRVLLLGDSFTEGMQVALEKTFAKRLEAKLEDRGREIEVINAGFSGFGTDNELLFFTSEGERYQPDLVLLAFSTANDVIENSDTLYRRMYADAPLGAPAKPHFRLRRDGSLQLDARAARRHWEEFEARRSSLIGRALMALEENLHLVRLAESVIWRPSKPHDAAQVVRSTAAGIYATARSPRWDHAWALTRVLLQELRREVEGRGAIFATAVIPAKEAVSPLAWQNQLAFSPGLRDRTFDLEQPTNMIVSFLKQEQIPHVDLLPALRSHLRVTGRTGYFPWDVHLDEEGHELVADALTELVAARLTTGARGG
jgi:lysophospholipase L1-like esterase